MNNRSRFKRSKILILEWTKMGKVGIQPFLPDKLIDRRRVVIKQIRFYRRRLTAVCIGATNIRRAYRWLS